MNLTASHKKAQEVAAGQTICSFISAMLVIQMLSSCSQCCSKKFFRFENPTMEKFLHFENPTAKKFL